MIQDCSICAGSQALGYLSGPASVEVHDAAGTRDVVEPALLKERGPFANIRFSAADIDF